MGYIALDFSLFSAAVLICSHPPLSYCLKQQFPTVIGSVFSQFKACLLVWPLQTTATLPCIPVAKVPQGLAAEWSPLSNTNHLAMGVVRAVVARVIELWLCQSAAVVLPPRL
jgi:hypothetical protein